MAGPATLAATQAAAAAAPVDPWQSGLDLLLGNSAADEALPLHLTDAGLEALLAPFQDWPCLLPPAAQAPAAAHAVAAPQPLPSLHPAQGTAAPPAAPAFQRAASCAAPVPPSDAHRTSSLGSGSSGAAASGGSDGGSDGGGGGAPRRKGGRPRLHHPTAATAAAGASQAPAQQPYKKGGRGPKPKYLFGSREEAADARRERNRKAALDSYYRQAMGRG